MLDIKLSNVSLKVKLSYEANSMKQQVDTFHQELSTGT